MPFLPLLHQIKMMIYLITLGAYLIKSKCGCNLGCWDGAMTQHNDTKGIGQIEVLSWW